MLNFAHLWIQEPKRRAPAAAGKQEGASRPSHTHAQTDKLVARAGAAAGDHNRVGSGAAALALLWHPQEAPRAPGKEGA
jgi:hypothetical protein